MYANGFDGNKYGSPPTGEDGELLDGISALFEGLAWEMYAINFDEKEGKYLSVYDEFGDDLTWPWKRTTSIRGGIGEYDFSIGFNFDHTFFWGATLGIQDVKYQVSYFHEESPDFRESMQFFCFSNENAISGAGINFKTGIIYRPIHALRFGATVHTPTQLWLKSSLFSTMETKWNKLPATDDGKAPHSYLTTGKDDLPLKYRITTPWRFGLSAAAVVGKFGMANVDVEMVDYSSSSMSPKVDYNFDNDAIKMDFKTVMNVRGGVEARLGPVFLRGGVAFYGNPYNKTSPNFNDEVIKKTLKGTMSYSGGIGFRNRDFYMDAAYSYMQFPERINTLFLSEFGDEHAKLQTTANKVIVTFGFRF
jgi:hypothetical protein